MTYKLTKVLLACSLMSGLVACSTNQTTQSNDSTDKSSMTVDVKETKIDLAQDKDNKVVYSYTSTNKIDYSGVYQPQFFVYAGNKSKEEAEALLNEMGIGSVVEQWAGSVSVINPQDGKEYTEKDSEGFIDLLAPGLSNVKVIGIEEGATFVNEYLSQKAYPIAGIFTYNGTMKDGVEKGAYVPAYLSNPDENAKNYFIDVNEAKKVSDTVYENEEDELRKVVIGNESSLLEAFTNAWNTVFSKNYRQFNELTEFYMADPHQYTDPYLLYNLTDFEALDMTFNAIYDEPVNGEGKYTWFEYIPNSVLDAEDGTVPLVLALHGNGNDPRLMGDSAGYPEVAAKEGFIVIAPEWQDIVYDAETKEPGPNFFGCDGLEQDKLIEWLKDVIEVKYPQIDTSRIYLTGLSAGGSASIYYAAKYSDVFAAAAPISAPGVDRNAVAEIAKDYKGGEIALSYVAGDHDFFGMLPVDGSSKNSFKIADDLYIQNVDENCDIFSFIQSYMTINGLKAPETWNMDDNAWFGIKLEEEETITLGTKTAHTGVIKNEHGVIMKFTAIENQAHWTYKPEAEFQYDFLKHYSRGEDGSLIFE